LQKGGEKTALSGELFQLIRRRGILYQFVPSQKLDRITRKNHQGAIGFTTLVAYAPLEEVTASIWEKGETPLIVILDKVTDVRNLGAIARSAECAGAHAIVFPEQNSAQINASAVKSSAGALFKIPLCRSKNLKEDIRYLKQSGLQIVAATEKADFDYFKTDFTKPTAIIMGSEDRGISQEYLALSDVKAAIPVRGEIASLNVSAAASVLLYEAVRQRIST